MANNRTPSRKLAAIMFADMVGFTAMMQEDEGRAMQRRNRQKDVIEQKVKAHSGEVIQFYGDGTLSIFPSAREAVLAAQEVQQLLRSDPVVPLRIGIHLGDIVHDQDGIFGDGVNVASRIESLAIPGSVLFSEKVQQEIENHPSIQSLSLGRFSFKNVKRTMEVYALNHEDLAVPTPQEIGSSKAQREEKSIAVLPFANMSASRESEYFAEGVSEEIINGLSRVEGLSLISRTTALAIRDERDAIERSRQLKVGYLLEGSVRKAADQVRVSVQLTNTADGYQIWSERYDRKLVNIFELQDEIARHVVNALKVSFDLGSKNKKLVSRPTDNLEAWNLYMKGLHLWNKQNPEAGKKAIEIFRQVTELDPSFSSAHCALANCYSFLGSSGIMLPAEAYAKAMESAMRAIEMDPRDPEAHLSMAMIKFFHFWDWEGTLSSLKRAEELGLNSSLMHQTYGLYLAAVGRLDEGVKKMERAVRQDPLSIPSMATLVSLYIFNEQYDKALAVIEEILELDPTFRKAHEGKGIIHMCRGEHDQALAEFTTYQEMVGHPLKGLTGLLLIHGELGNPEKLEEYLDRLRKRQEQEPRSSLEIDFALAYFAKGDYDLSIDYMEQVYDKRFSVVCMGMIWMIRCPYFQPLWHEPRFQKLLDKMGLGVVEVDS